MTSDFNKLISLGARVALFGFIASGPIGLFLVNSVQPQPLWKSAAVFAEHYSMVQDLPYYCGFLLVGGMLMLAAGHYLNYQGENTMKKFHLFLAVAWTIVFCALITFNYICQNTYVRHLAQHYRAEYDAAISIFSMSNPMSLCWAIEMWGYGFLGIATWLMAGYYQGKNNLVRRLLITNGVVSLTGTILTIVSLEWVMEKLGLISFLVWNALMILLCILMDRHAKKEHRKHTGKY